MVTRFTLWEMELGQAICGGEVNVNHSSAKRRLGRHWGGKLPSADEDYPTHETNIITKQHWRTCLN